MAKIQTALKSFSDLKQQQLKEYARQKTTKKFQMNTLSAEIVPGAVVVTLENHNKVTYPHKAIFGEWINQNPSNSDTF